MWVPHIGSMELITINRTWTEWYVRKEKLSAWHTGAYETFCGMHVTTIFLMACA
jgi:hypothetical protein